MSEIYEKKIEYLKERKDDLERRLLRAEDDLRDKAKSYDEVLYELRQLQKAADEEIGHLKLISKSKADEVTRVRNLYEDNMLLVKECKLENETLK